MIGKDSDRAIPLSKHSCKMQRYGEKFISSQFLEKEGLIRSHFSFDIELTVKTWKLLDLLHHQTGILSFMRTHEKNDDENQSLSGHPHRQPIETGGCGKEAQNCRAEPIVICQIQPAFQQKKKKLGYLLCNL